jgi:hypothetical protein
MLSRFASGGAKDLSVASVSASVFPHMLFDVAELLGSSSSFASCNAAIANPPSARSGSRLVIAAMSLATPASTGPRLRAATTRLTHPVVPLLA